MEHQLFEHFFPGSAAVGAPGLEGLMDPLCTILYDALRPAFITLQPLEELCELVDILKHEVRNAIREANLSQNASKRCRFGVGDIANCERHLFTVVRCVLIA